MTALLIGEVLLAIGSVGGAVSAFALRAAGRRTVSSKAADINALFCRDQRLPIWENSKPIRKAEGQRPFQRAFDAISTIRDEEELHLLSEKIRDRIALLRAQEQNPKDRP
jgi:hypothetical protein